MPHDYASDRLFIYLKVDGEDGNDELDEKVRNLREAGHPRVTLYLSDQYAIAGEFFRWEYATAVTGKLFGINPFDDPNVTEAKEATGRLLEFYTKHDHLPHVEKAFIEDGVELYLDDKTLKSLAQLALQYNYSSGDLTGLVAALLNSTRANDYFAIMAYIPMTDAADAALKEVARRMRHTTRRAVTIGYGPRFLHSTGQLHKGGPNNGHFIQITCDDPEDVEIPGVPYSFSILKSAQAAGDLETLRSKERRAIRLHLTGDVVTGIRQLLKAIDMVDAKRK